MQQGMNFMSGLFKNTGNIFYAFVPKMGKLNCVYFCLIFYQEYKYASTLYLK
jgi:hypothetical protein